MEGHILGGVGLLVYAYFRMFSKNYSKRYAENQAFMKYTAKIRLFLGQQKQYDAPEEDVSYL